MNDSTDTNRPRWLLVTLGILLMVLGVVALASPFYTTYFSATFLGWILVLAGIAQFAYAFFSGGVGRAFFFLFTGLLSTLAGAVLIYRPFISLATLAYFIGIYLLVIGIYRGLAALIQRRDRWGWTFTGGVISLLLGGMIINGWPTTGLWVIGAFVGIELIIRGFLLMVAPSESMSIEDRGYKTGYFSGAKGGRSGGNKDDHQ